MKILIIILLFNLSLFSSDWSEINGPYEHKSNTIIYFFDSTNVLMVQGNGTTAYSNDLANTWEDPFYPDESPHLYNYIDFQGDILYSTGKKIFEDETNIYKITNFGKDYKSIGKMKEYYGEITSFNDKVFYSIVQYDDDGMYDRGWRILKTNNAGATWDIRKSFNQKTIEKLYLVDDNTNYVIFSNGEVQRSDSNAISWERLNFSVENENTFQMLDKSTGFYSNGIILMKTTNAWQESDTLIKLENLDTKIIDIEFLDENIGWIACENGCLYKTNDGGVNWVVDKLNNIEFKYQVEKIQVISENRVSCKVRHNKEHIAHYFVNFSNTTSLNKQNENSFFSYNDGILTINSESNGIANIKVYNLLGSIIHSETLNIYSGINSSRLNLYGVNLITIEFDDKIFRQVIITN